MPSADDIIAEIQAAFPAQRSAPFDPMVNSSKGDEPAGVERDFADADDWTVLSGKWLDEAPDGLSSALSFFSPEALCFYIPAYLVADLRQELDCVDPSFHLLHGFEERSYQQKITPPKERTWTDHATQNWAGLSTEQALAIVHYLEWCAASDEGFGAEDIEQGLEYFWLKKARRL